MPAPTPYHGFCVALARILPSRPMSITPLRSANRPAMAAKISTGALRTVDTRMLARWRSSNVMCLSFEPFEHGRNRLCVEVRHRAAEQNDQTLDEDEVLGWDVGFFQRQGEASRYQRAEQHG